MTLTYEQYSRHLASLDQQEIQARVDGDEEKSKKSMIHATNCMRRTKPVIRNRISKSKTMELCS